MKKIISICLMLIMCITMCAGCKNDSKVDKSQKSDTNAAISDIGEESKSGDNSYILSLNPTHKKTSDYPFKDWELWSVNNEIDDIGHLSNGRYEFGPNNPAKYGFAPADVQSDVSGTWEEISVLPVNDIQVYSGYRPLYVQSDDTSGGCVVEYEFEQDLPNDMTIGEAYEQGYWKYTKWKQGGFYYNVFFDESPSTSCVEAIVDKWGQPSEVYYMAFDTVIMFFLVYETDENVIVLSGSEVLNDVSDDIDVETIIVCGKNSSGYAFDGVLYSKIK